jgi:uncharacterized protein YhaN
MPRSPYPIQRARRVLAEWIAIAKERPADVAPITVEEAQRVLKEKDPKLAASRNTLWKYGLTRMLEQGAEAQKAGAGETARASERQGYVERFEAMEAQIRGVEARNRELLGQIATMTFNARRLGVNAAELRTPMPKPDRSASRAGRRGGRT